MRKLTLFLIPLLLGTSLVMAQPAPTQPPVQAELLSYGRDALQRIDFWRGAGKDAPLILFIHGGGWSRGDKGNATGTAMVGHFTAQGYAIGSMNYRLVPDVTVEQEAQDVADAVAYMLARAKRLNIDPRKIILMGHSAGAHLAALVGTDPRYLRQAGLDPSVLGGVILLDGAGYDVATQIRDAGPLLRRLYERAFGSDLAAQQKVSPTRHVAKPNAESFLILHVKRADSEKQSNLLADMLRAQGTPARVEKITASSHARLNRQMGTAGDPATALVDGYAAKVFAFKGDWKRVQLLPVRE